MRLERLFFYWWCVRAGRLGSNEIRLVVVRVATAEDAVLPASLSRESSRRFTAVLKCCSIEG